MVNQTLGHFRDLSSELFSSLLLKNRSRLSGIYRGLIQGIHYLQFSRLLNSGISMFGRSKMPLPVTKMHCYIQICSEVIIINQQASPAPQSITKRQQERDD